MHRSSRRWTAVSALVVLAALGPATANAQLPELPVPVPTVTPPKLPELPPVKVPELPPVEVPDLVTPVRERVVTPVRERVVTPVVERVESLAPAKDVASAPSKARVAPPSAGGDARPRAGSGSGAGREQQAPGSTPPAAGAAAAHEQGAADSTRPAGQTANAAAHRRKSATGTRARSRAQPPKPRQRRERKLRRIVTELSGCLDTIGPLQRRVLVLRAGVGRHRPHSRRAVAERLHTSVRRVARTERRGLRALRGSACAGDAAAGVAASPSATGAPPATPVVAPQDRSAGAQDPRAVVGVQEEFRTGGPPSADPETLLPPPEDATEPPLLILLTAAFVLGFAAVWARERRRLSPSRRAPPAPRRS